MKSQYKKYLALAIVLIALLTVLAIANKEDEKEPVVQQSRCLDVPESIVSGIGSGLKDEGNVGEAKAVKSNDFNNVYFVSTNVDGKVATFSTNDIESTGMVESVNDVALDLFEWPDSSKSDAKITMNDDGALESQKCLTN